MCGDVASHRRRTAAADRHRRRAVARSGLVGCAAVQLSPATGQRSAGARCSTVRRGWAAARCTAPRSRSAVYRFCHDDARRAGRFADRGADCAAVANDRRCRGRQSIVRPGTCPRGGAHRSKCQQRGGGAGIARRCGGSPIRRPGSRGPQGTRCSGARRTARPRRCSPDGDHRRCRACRARRHRRLAFRQGGVRPSAVRLGGAGAHDGNGAAGTASPTCGLRRRPRRGGSPRRPRGDRARW